MSDTVTKAIEEIKIKKNLTIDDKQELAIYNMMLKIVKQFVKQGHSGGSAHFFANKYSSDLRKLLLQQPITPLTGYVDEWVEVMPEVWQNNRCSSVFKEPVKGEGIQAHDIDAVTFIHEGDTIDSTVTSGDYVRAYYDCRAEGYIKFPYAQPSMKPVVLIEPLMNEGRVVVVKEVPL